MVKLLIDLTPRFQSAFGVVPLLAENNAGQAPGAQYINLYRGATIVGNDRSFEDVQLSNTEKSIDLYFGARELSKTGILGNYFAPPPMIGVHRSKNLIITPIDGADAEVVERYGDASWEIIMQGLIVDMENHQFPFDRIAELNRAFSVGDHFEVASNLFDSLNISSIYFTEVDINGVQGFEDTISYTLKARSIKPVEFYLNGEEE